MVVNLEGCFVGAFVAFSWICLIWQQVAEVVLPYEKQ
jgi:hypothetical protein